MDPAHAARTGAGAEAEVGIGAEEAAPELQAEAGPPPSLDLPVLTPAPQFVKLSEKPIHIAAQKEMWLFQDRKVDLESIDFDLEAKAGQIRAMSSDILRRKREQFQLEEPLGPVRCLLVATDLSGVSGGNAGMLGCNAGYHFLHAAF